MLLRVQSPNAMLRRIATMRKKSCDRGEIVAERIKPGHTLLRMQEWSEMPDQTAIGFAVAIETIMRLAGRQSPVVKWSRVADEVHFHVYFDHAASNLVDDDPLA